MHTAVTGGSELGGGAGEAGAAQVLDTDNHTGVVEVEAAFDEDLLGEGIAHLYRRELLVRLSAGLVGGVVEGFGGQYRDAADTVEAGGGSEEDDLVALAGGKGKV